GCYRNGACDRGGSARCQRRGRGMMPPVSHLVICPAKAEMAVSELLNLAHKFGLGIIYLAVGGSGLDQRFEQMRCSSGVPFGDFSKSRGQIFARGAQSHKGSFEFVENGGVNDLHSSGIAQDERYF